MSTIATPQKNTALKNNTAQEPQLGTTIDKPRVRKAIEDAGMRLAGRFGTLLNGTLGSRVENAAAGVLTYHRISPIVRKLPAPLHNVTPRRFYKQLKGLKDRGFNFWPLKWIVQYYNQEQELPANTIAVTFDDGFESVHKYAWPLLKKLDIPATIFLNTAYTDSEMPFPFDAWGVAHYRQAPPQTFRPLSGGQCQEMIQNGLLELGAHTHTHEDFRNRPDDFRQDVIQNLEVLENRFRVQAPLFAYPYGSRYLGFASAEMAYVLRDLGFQCAVTTESGNVRAEDDRMMWRRFNAFSWDTATTLAAKLQGWYAWAPKLRQRIVGRA